MRKFFVSGFITLSVFTVMLTFIGFRSVLFAKNLTEDSGLKITGGGTFVLQGTPELNNGTDDAENDAAYTFDLKFIKEFENNGKILLHFEGGRGTGLDTKAGTYATKNKDASSTVGSSFIHVKITELFYQQSFINNKLTANIGKVGFGAYFDNNNYAGDATSQFITGCFASNQLIDTPAQRLGLRLNYAVLDKLDISYGYFSTNVDNFDKKSVNVLQAAYKPFETGNYRLCIWTNSSDYYAYKDFKKVWGIYGVGLSADQAVNNNVGIFARLGYRDPSVCTSASADIAKNNIPAPSIQWSTGVQIKGSCWSRPDDKIGFAIGQIFGSSDYKKYVQQITVNNKDQDYKDDAETQIELYYSYLVNRYLTLSPAVQYFINPKGGNAATSDNVFVYGIRLQMSF